jgi:peptidoglycan/LPS O-acetylase OafA/YrhL
MAFFLRLLDALTLNAQQFVMLQSVKQRENAYFPSIDGLRAVAVLAVITFHLAPAALPGGFVGVDIFFVISGYVVTMSLVGRLRQSLLQFILGFYARRILRIFPALLVCVFAVSIFAVLFIPPGAWLGSANRKTALYAIFGLSNYALIWSSDGYFSPRVEFNPFTHTWSLGVEEQFYLIAPAIVYFWLASRSQTGARRVIPLAALVLLAMVSCSLAAYNTFANPEAAFYLTPSRFWELASGVLLFQIQYEREFRTDYLSWSGAPLGSLLILCALLFTDKVHFPFPWAVVSVAGVALLIASFTARPSKPSFVEKILSTRQIVYIGKISYSLYLWHWPIFVMLRWTVGLDDLRIMAAAVILTFLMGAASYHFVEQPIRRMRPFILRPHWQTVVAGLATMTLCFIATYALYANANTLSLSVVKNAEVWSPYFLPNVPSGSCSVRVNNQHMGKLDLTGLIPTECPNDHISRGKLFIVGDSHAGAYQRMAFDLARERGVEIWIYGMTCGGVANLLRPLKPECLRSAEAALEDVKTKGKPDDIVFLASLRIYRLADQWAIFDSSEVLRRQSSNAAQRDRDSALDDARAHIRGIRNLGFHVMLDAPMPVFRSIPFRCSDWFNKMNPICASGKSLSKHFLEDHRQSTMQAISKLKTEFPDVFIYDAFSRLCPGDQCSSWDDEGPLFFDGDHLTGHGNEILYPSFRQSVENFWGNFDTLTSKSAGHLDH